MYTLHVPDNYISLHHITLPYLTYSISLLGSSLTSLSNLQHLTIPGASPLHWQETETVKFHVNWSPTVQFAHSTLIAFFLSFCIFSTLFYTPSHWHEWFTNYTRCCTPIQYTAVLSNVSFHIQFIAVFFHSLTARCLHHSETSYLFPLYTLWSWKLWDS